MKRKRKLSTTAGVLLILMLASGAQASTVVLGKIDFMRGTETRMFPFQIIGGGHFKATLTDFEFPAPFDVLAPAILRGKEIVGTPLLGSGMFKFQAAPGIFSANVHGVAFERERTARGPELEEFDGCRCPMPHGARRCDRR